MSIHRRITDAGLTYTRQAANNVRQALAMRGIRSLDDLALDDQIRLADRLGVHLPELKRAMQSRSRRPTGARRSSELAEARRRELAELRRPQGKSGKRVPVLGSANGARRELPDRAPAQSSRTPRRCPGWRMKRYLSPSRPRGSVSPSRTRTTRGPCARTTGQTPGAPSPALHR